MDDHDYRLAALRAWHKASANADQDLARQYRTLAHAYLALARLTADRALAAGLLSPEDAERLLGALGDR